MKINDFPLLYNARAHFSLGEKYPDGCAAAVLQPGREGHDALLDVLTVLMEEAELCRRAMGHDRRELPSREQMDALLTPLQEVKLKGRCIEAINRGLEAEEETGEVKKKRPSDDESRVYRYDAELGAAAG